MFQIDLDGIDKSVIADLLSEKLPSVWMDAQKELDNGMTLKQVIGEMKDGHILRILRKCGYDAESWIKEFEDFHDRS